MNNINIILIDGVRYHKKRPSSCRQCSFWKNRKVGCTLGKGQCESRHDLYLGLKTVSFY